MEKVPIYPMNFAFFENKKIRYCMDALQKDQDNGIISQGKWCCKIQKYVYGNGQKEWSVLTTLVETGYAL